ncbi:MAG: protein phosphatase 2C domain-containing protein [Proteobacteria bacterium]|nr:protein phosphatase 2C domain-containing protein [Pseudomonadota bacterium]
MSIGFDGSSGADMQFDLNGKFRAAGLTNPGQMRENNEDNFLIDTNAGLLVVADGMGGHQSGELASADAIRVMQEILTAGSSQARRPENSGNGTGNGPGNGTGHGRVATAITAANDVINTLNLERGYGPRDAMGTTIVGLYFEPERPMDATIFHVGDSRFYRFRNGALDRITRDHSAYENWLEDGSKGPAPGLHILSQAIGPSDSVAPGIQQQTFRPGDIVLLCSDGLTNLVSDSDIEALLTSMDINDLSSGCHALVEAAQSNGGTDNITVVLGAYSGGGT